MSEAATAQKIDEPVDPDAQPELPTDEKVSPPGVNRFGLQAERNQKWRLDVPHNTSPEQCLDEDYWAHIAGHLRPGDEVRVFPDNMAWELVLHVIDAGHAWAHVAKKAFHEYSTREQMESVPSIYEVRYAGTTHKYQVLRKGKLLKEFIETEALARRAAANHEAAVKR